MTITRRALSTTYVGRMFMMLRSLLLWGVLALIPILAVPCHSVASEEETTPGHPSDQVEVLAPLSIRLADYKALSLEITAATADAEEDVPDLRRNLANQFERSKLFEMIGEGVDSSLLLKVKLLSLKKVGVGKRLLLGMLAGFGRGDAVVEVVDTKTKRLMGSFKVEGKGFNSPIENMAETIVAYLKEVKNSEALQMPQVSRQVEPNTSSRSSSETATIKSNKRVEAETQIGKPERTQQSGTISSGEKAENILLLPSQDFESSLQKVEELHNAGILGGEDYQKAKQRVSNIQRIEELHRSGILSDEEYSKAKSRLTENGR